jgi:hypothetical protein
MRKAVRARELAAVIGVTPERLSGELTKLVEAGVTKGWPRAASRYVVRESLDRSSATVPLSPGAPT